MRHSLFHTALLLSLTLGSGALAAATRPAIVYSSSDKYDQSINQSIYENAVQPFVQETGIKVEEREPANETERLGALRSLAKAGFDPIVLVTDTQIEALRAVAQAYPHTRFTLLDGKLALPNVQSIQFKDEEAAFLVGALAAAESETGRIGFIGGMDSPSIRRVACGYEQGAKYAYPAIQIRQSFVTSPPGLVMADPAKGSYFAKQQIAEGVDVLFAAARKTGNGVYQAAADAGVKAIGSEINQNSLFPETMLTSMTRDLAKAAYSAWKQAEQGTWQPGVQQLGLAENAIGWALDKSNLDKIDPALIEKINGLREAILSGQLKVHDYSSDGQCQYSMPKQGAICTGPEQDNHLCRS